MMRRRDACDQSVIATEMAAIHADIAYSGLAINGDEGCGNANTAAKPRFFDRRRQVRQAKIFQRLTAVNDFLDRCVPDSPRPKWIRQRLKSGPLGGDQQIGAMIVENNIDFLIFFWDPLEPLPHDPDVKALLRMAVVWNIPIACNPASADFMISSPLMDGEYYRLVPDYGNYANRTVNSR